MLRMSDATLSQRAALTRLRRVRDRLEKATAILTLIEEERAAAYLAARDCDPPITFKAIADVFGITEAAVMQKSKKALAARDAR